MRFCKPQALMACFILSTTTLLAQPGNDYFSPLSSSSYANRIAAIKSRTIPETYENKKEQKTYAGIIKDRNESIAGDLEKDRIVFDSLLLNKSLTIIERIKNANKAYSFDSINVYINRSTVANASCHGEGTLYINLGLFLWVDNDDELAMVIGHELSHQFLNHSESKIKQNIALFSSDVFNEEMKAIKKSSTGKYERYKNLVKDIVTTSGKHSRYKESDADSLGVMLIRNAGYDVSKAANILLKLNKTDDLFISPGIYDVKGFFERTGIDGLVLQRTKKYNGLSTVNVTMNADKDIDSVRTHPDCIDRYKTITRSTDVQEASCCKKIDPISFQIKERALVEMARYAYQSSRYTLCIHLCLFALNNNFDNPVFNTFISSSFSGIYYADKKFERFSVTDAGAAAGSTLKDLQDFIFNSSSLTIINLAEHFKNNSSSKTSDDYYFAEAMYSRAVEVTDEAAAHAKFKSKYPHSKYNLLFKL